MVKQLAKFKKKKKKERYQAFKLGSLIFLHLQLFNICQPHLKCPHVVAGMKDSFRYDRSPADVPQRLLQHGHFDRFLRRERCSCVCVCVRACGFSDVGRGGRNQPNDLF